MNKPKAKFDYGVTQGVLWIIDHDNGSMSLTNDMERVLDYIYSLEDGAKGLPIVYRDSSGIWDAVTYEQGFLDFISLMADSRTQAIELILIRK